MSSPNPADSLRTLAFGGEGSEPWGAGWFPPPGGSGVLLVAAGEAALAIEAELEESVGGGWRVRCAAGELEAAPAAEALELSTGEDAATGFEQLCTVTGELAIAGGPTRIAGPGRRGSRRGGLGAVDSVREVAAWFESGDAIEVLALRPRKGKGKGQDQDALSAAVIDPEGSPVITDPRLSTTYTAAGHPARVGLELWSDDPESFPRRLAGESTGRRVAGAVAGWSVSAERLVCHARGRDGAGVYLIARPD